LDAGALALIAAAALAPLTALVCGHRLDMPIGGALIVGDLLLVVTAGSRQARQLAERTAQARNEERQRLARDLHDGLAQDLAVIASFGQRLNSELGPEHPVIAATRGVMVDLAAASAPDTVSALEHIAGELSRRHDVLVNVCVDAPGINDVEPDASQRENLVRIAREAVVNAARHGGARRIDINLMRRNGALQLSVTDDGCGIGTVSSHRRAGGLGLPAMRARAEALGGRLTAARRTQGGTELAVVVPQAGPVLEQHPVEAPALRVADATCSEAA
jgi:signal transduction histidine kinase